MVRRRLASVSALAAAAAVGVCLNAAVALADSTDSTDSDTSSQSQPPARTAQHGAESGTSSGHRGARLPAARSAMKDPDVSAADPLPSPQLLPQPIRIVTHVGIPVDSSPGMPLPEVVPIAPPVVTPHSIPTLQPPLAAAAVPAPQPVAAVPAPQPAVPTRPDTWQPPPVVTAPAAAPSGAIAPAPAPDTSLMVAVSRFLASLSDALSGNTIPADAAVGVMSEVVRRGRFAPTTVAGPVAAATTTSSTTTAVESEKMTISPSGVSRVVSDRNASGGSALAITDSATASTTVTVSSATTGLVIRAKTNAGAPDMTVAIDGVAVTTLKVTSTRWTDFTFAGVVPAGSHVLSVSSTTATATNSLYLDKISTMTGPIVDNFTGRSGTKPSDALWGLVAGSGWDTGIQTYTTNNAFLDGQGHLVIQAVRGKRGTYTSAEVWSKNDVSYGYGTVTARIKMPKGQGIWPAFWMVGADADTISWPASGEIDIVELPSTTTTLYSTLHGPIAGTTATQQAQVISTLPDLSTDYHNYWVRHLPDEITFGIDNQTLGTLTPDDLGPGETWVYNRPMYVILNVAVGGPWAGAPNNTTPSTSKMLVDSVRWDPPA